jgi:hypothetical protein
VIVRVLFATLVCVACNGLAVAQGSVTSQEYDRLTPIDEPYRIDEHTELIFAAYEFSGVHRVTIHARNLDMGWVSLVTDLPVRHWRLGPGVPAIIGTINAIDVNQDGRSEIVLSRNLHPHGWEDRLIGQAEDGSDWVELLSIAGWSTNHDFSNNGFVVGAEQSEIWGRDSTSETDHCWRWEAGVELSGYAVSEGPCHRQTDRALLRASRLVIIFGLPEEAVE